MRPHTPCTNSSNAPLAAPLDHSTHIAGTRTFHRFHHNHHTPLTFSIGHFSGAATARCSQLYPFLGPLPTPWLLRTLRPLPPLPRSILCAPARRTANAWRGIGARRLAAAANTPTPSARALTLTLTPRPTRWRCLPPRRQSAPRPRPSCRRRKCAPSALAQAVRPRPSEKEKRPSEQEKEVVRRSDPGLCGLRLARDVWHGGRCVQ